MGTIEHCDAEHGLLYTSPHLPKPLEISLADAKGDEDRRLFSHFLWNSSLQLAELIESGTLGLEATSEPTSVDSQGVGKGKVNVAPSSAFKVTDLHTIELGAGTALPSILSALLGAGRVVVTDYPAPVVIDALQRNISANVRSSFSPLAVTVPVVEVEGHAWGEMTTSLATENKHAFDRVFVSGPLGDITSLYPSRRVSGAEYRKVLHRPLRKQVAHVFKQVADCLWMPWQHGNLRRSIAWFLKGGTTSRAWVVGGFHTGREKMRGFFDADALLSEGLEVESIWERDCDGADREWAWDRGLEDVTVSAALAGGVVLSAFHQRANFYSAMVHLSQSSLSLMVLVNLVFVVYGTLIYGLQRLCFGPLRPVEIEQLYEKAWFAVTETCLAMTIFREEVGAFFLVMFTALVTGKVWGWIGEGRVEVLEQQPPANPGLFHTRLSISLLLSILYDTWLLGYAVNTVVQQARPTMMVMFLFEFAVLTVCSFQTGSRYLISLIEQRVVKLQTQQRLEERRRQVRDERAAALRRREEEGNIGGDEAELPNEDDVDEMDIEVPGWESKGQWILTLDLVADFVKLGIYTAFFCVLFTFYGLPIHIIRDWFMTTRSFLKRLTALIRYRQALKDMNQYADATPEELDRENTCIICREEMRPWDPADTTQVERTRAKKLPCGHILHFGCLKSWLERQQVCPTCRRPVAREGDQAARNGDAVMFRLRLNLPGGQNRQADPPANGQAQPGQAAPAAPHGHGQENQNQNQNQNQQNQNRGVRMFNLGPLRLGIAQGGVNDLQEMAQRLGVPAPAPIAPPAQPRPATQQPTSNDAAPSLDQIRAQLLDVGQRVQQEIATLNNAAHELQTLNYIVNELGRLRQLQQQHGQPGQPGQQQIPPAVPMQLPPLQPQQHQPWGMPPAMFPPMPPGPFPLPLQSLHPLAHRPPAAFTRHGAAGYGTAIPAGSPDLPEGVVIPPGWSLLPLQRLDGGAPPLDPTVPAPEIASNSRQPRGNNAAAPSASESTGRSGTSSATGVLLADATSARLTTAPPEGASTTAAPVTAPTPVAPTWGGSAQFLANRTAPGIFGYQPETAPASQDQDGEASEVPATANGSAAESSEPSGSADNKGKAKAATVEEASDDEDEV
ncbi:hypothetical protein OQA88_4931 [Cercophora sp. LCS_1]